MGVSYIEQAASDKFDSVTIEPGGHGTTYSRPDGFTVYGHKPYPENSVLEGQDQRCWLGHYDTVEDAQRDFPMATLIAGSSYAPPILAHLSEDGDPEPYDPT